MPNKKPTLDDYLSKKKKVPSKNKKGSVPPDYDVILPGMGYTRPTAKKQPKRIIRRSEKPVPLAPKPKLSPARPKPKNTKKK